MVSPQRFKVKPVTVEAVQFAGGVEDAADILEWIISADGTASCTEEPKDVIFVETLLGLKRALKGDWIIKKMDEDGPHFEVCPENIFSTKYEQIEICYVRG